MLSRTLYFLKDFSTYLILIFLTLTAVLYFSFKIYKSKAEKKQKNIKIALLFTLLSFILVYSAFEGYFRYVYDESDGLGFLKVNAKWHQRHVVTNTYFVRDRDFKTEKEPQTVRIGVIGDSITFGGGIENPDDRFSNLLEKNLRAQGKKVEVFNLGKLGYDTQAEIKEYEKFKHLNFDIIVWQYFLNDIQPEGQSTGTPIISKNSQRAKFLEFLSNQSFFFDFVYWRFSSKYQNTIEQLKNADLNQFSNQEVFTNHQKDIKDFLKSQKTENKKVVVIIFPFVHQIGKNYPVQIHQRLNETFKEDSEEVIDLLEYLKDEDPKTLVASKFDAHPNEKVHKTAADLLTKSIEKILSSTY